MYNHNSTKMVAENLRLNAEVGELVRKFYATQDDRHLDTALEIQKAIAENHKAIETMRREQR